MAIDLSDIAEDFSGAAAFAPMANCPICGGPSTVAHPAFNIHPQKPHRFDLRVCKRCRHGWVDPMPSQDLLSYLYSRGSLSVIGAWAQTTNASLSIPAQLVVNSELDAGRPTGTYFELGIGQAELYSSFLRAGWQCIGVEPGPWGRRIKNVFSDISEVPASTAADVIALLDVLEHLADPVTTMKQVRRLTAPGCRLYCAVPNRQSLRSRIWRTKWRMLRPIGHVHYWSKQSVLRAMASAGFRVVAIRATDLRPPGPITSARDAVLAAVEHLGLGDQWMVVAEPALETSPRPGHG